MTARGTPWTLRRWCVSSIRGSGLLPPGAFLPAIAGTPLEVELGLWGLRSAAAQLAHWCRAGRTLLLSSNVYSGALLLPELADTVAGYLPHIGLAAAGAGRGIEL